VAVSVTSVVIVVAILVFVTVPTALSHC